MRSSGEQDVEDGPRLVALVFCDDVDVHALDRNQLPSAVTLHRTRRLVWMKDGAGQLEGKAYASWYCGAGFMSAIVVFAALGGTPISGTSFQTNVEEPGVFEYVFTISEPIDAPGLYEIRLIVNDRALGAWPIRIVPQAP